MNSAGAFLGLVGVVGFVMAIRIAQEDVRAVSYRKVDAIIEASGPERGVRYAYEVEGRRVSSSDPAKNPENYRPGQKTTAFYDPLHPTISVLSRREDAVPYAGMLVAVFFLDLLFLIASQGTSSDAVLDVHPPRKREQGFEIMHREGLTRRALAHAGFTVIWFVGSIGGVLVAGLPKSESVCDVVLLMTAIFALLGMIPLYFSYRTVFFRLSVDDPRVFIDRETIHLGEEIIVRVEQRERRQLDRASLGVALVRERVTHYSEDTDVALMAENKVTFEALSGECTFQVPLDAPPTHRHGHTHHRWEIAIETVLGDAKLKTSFPIRVSAGG